MLSIQTLTEEEKRKKRIQYNKEWRKNNKAKVDAYNADRYLKDPDKFKTLSKIWQSQNKERVLKNASEWAAKNQDARKIYRGNRRARKISAGGSLSKGLAEKLLILQKGKCPCCRLPLYDDYHMDHIIPLALGGSNTDDNIQLLHGLCNRQKHSKNPIDFMQSRGYLI